MADQEKKEEKGGFLKSLLDPEKFPATHRALKEMADEDNAWIRRARRINETRDKQVDRVEKARADLAIAESINDSDVSDRIKNRLLNRNLPLVEEPEPIEEEEEGGEH